MNSLLYYIIILSFLSFWFIGYIYVKRQNEITAKENSLAIIRSKRKYQIEGLNKTKEQLQKEIKYLEAEFKKLQAEHEKIKNEQNT